MVLHWVGECEAERVTSPLVSGALLRVRRGPLHAPRRALVHRRHKQRPAWGHGALSRVSEAGVWGTSLHLTVPAAAPAEVAGLRRIGEGGGGVPLNNVSIIKLHITSYNGKQEDPSSVESIPLPRWCSGK